MEGKETQTVVLRGEPQNVKVTFCSYPKRLEEVLKWKEGLLRACRQAGIKLEEEQLEVLKEMIPDEFKPEIGDDMTLQQAFDAIIRKQVKEDRNRSRNPPYQSLYCLISDYERAVETYEVYEHIEREITEPIREYLKCKQFFSGLGQTTRARLNSQDIATMAEAIKYIQKKELIALTDLETSRETYEDQELSSDRAETRNGRVHKSQVSKTEEQTNASQSQARKYCVYHGNNTHSTEDCRKVKALGEEKRGKRLGSNDRANGATKRPATEATQDKDSV
ncbi:hypothetical protein NEHOM01_2503 [Nematocida homosporus]|uniref:uncharacterized protein n=1 Tax=Nematocida homosporus TaxID=1912981 RepID=UPI002220D91F|nr:uncharacterized protein NEHOM01_2503 [Nematocida homosporus]KAI5188041.1 hypothetical protein NEHOM01_2503 [Nematocida homosporus]